MIKYLIMDVDGTLTDGKIYMGNEGEAIKAFSVKDGMVINYILKPAGIIPIIITARNSLIVQNRCNELGITEVHQGKLDKLATLKAIVGEDGLGSCAYFGDDILDLNCMLPIKEAGGFTGCPADAIHQVKAAVDYVCNNAAGEGALREFSEWLISPKVDEEEAQRRVDEAISYLSELSISVEDFGKTVEVNDYFFYSVQSYDTKPVDRCKLESHRKYIDIQVMVSGEESMDFVDISRLSVLEEYDEDKDVIFWNVPSRMSKTTLSKGDCIVLYPETAHRGAQDLNGKHHVLKIVGKCRIPFVI